MNKPVILSITIPFAVFLLSFFFARTLFATTGFWIALLCGLPFALLTLWVAFVIGLASMVIYYWAQNE